MFLIEHAGVQAFSILPAYEIYDTIVITRNTHNLELRIVCAQALITKGEADKSDELIIFRGKIRTL